VDPDSHSSCNRIDLAVLYPDPGIQFITVLIRPDPVHPDPHFDKKRFIRSTVKKFLETLFMNSRDVYPGSEFFLSRIHGSASNNFKYFNPKKLVSKLSEI
jgi:hypothetical protein